MHTFNFIALFLMKLQSIWHGHKNMHLYISLPDTTLGLKQDIVTLRNFQEFPPCVRHFK